MIQRWQLAELKHKLAYRRGVHLTGVRQAGKSTLAQMLELKDCRHYTLDDVTIRAVAESDPNGFVKHAQGEIIVIDEVQKVPSLLDAVKIVVDRDNSPGQYLLTGSSNLLFAKAVKDSLAGRLGKIRLRPLAYGEILGHSPTFLEHAFNGTLAQTYPDVDKRGIISQAIIGGYPEQMSFSASERKAWFREYVDDIISKDVQDITEVRKIDVLAEMTQWLLAHSAQFFSIDELATKISVSKETVQNYLGALKALYLFDCVPAWSKSDYAFLGKRPKWFVGDTGLMANVLGWTAEGVYLDESKNGKFIESWVYQQLVAIAEVSGEYEISHYRDNNKREIDFIVERTDGAMIGVEVKSGAVSMSDFKHLKWFKNNLTKDKFTGIVLYSGKDTLSFGEGLYAVPLSALGGI